MRKLPSFNNFAFMQNPHVYVCIKEELSGQKI